MNSERHGAEALHYSPSVTLCVMGAGAGPEVGFAQLALRAVADDKAPRPADLGTPRGHSRQPAHLRTHPPLTRALWPAAASGACIAKDEALPETGTYAARRFRCGRNPTGGQLTPRRHALTGLAAIAGRSCR